MNRSVFDGWAISGRIFGQCIVGYCVENDIVVDLPTFLLQQLAKVERTQQQTKQMGVVVVGGGATRTTRRWWSYQNWENHYQRVG
jgi:hypothetical protein